MKTIPLTRGKSALVDDDDYESLSRYKWHAVLTRRGGGWYARRAVTDTRKRMIYIYMHRSLLNAPPDKQVDHRDCDGLNCQRYNLRLATGAQNAQNKKPHRDNRSGFKGVRAYRKRWTARIYVDGTEKQIGTFSTPESAARAYDAVAKEYHGEFARLNFPQGETPCSMLSLQTAN